MPEISRITLPSGTTYDIKDTTARNMASVKIQFAFSSNAATTPKDVTWTKDGQTITGTLYPSSDTENHIYMVPMDNASGKDLYSEYITWKTWYQETPAQGYWQYKWEKIGDTDIDLSSLGALAYKDTVTTQVTPEGTVSQPTFTGNSMTSTGTYTPSGTIAGGSVSINLETTKKYVVSQAATQGGSVTPGTAASCTLPTLETTVSGETLTFSWTPGSFTANTPTAATMPTFSALDIVTGITSIGVTQPQFTGTEETISVSGTPSGTVSQPTFSGTQKAYVGS